MKKIQLKKAVLLAAWCAMMAIDARAQGSTPYVSPYGLRELVDGYYETKDGYTGTFLKYKDNNTLGKLRRVNAVDTLSIGMLDGHHWGGKELTIGEDMNNVYFVNKKTGEYLVLGESWGTTPMQDYTGTLFNLKAGQYCRADNWGKPGGKQANYQVDGNDPKLGDKAARNGKGYLISLAHDEETVLGRTQTSSGARGTFEYRAILMSRLKTRKEYAQHIKDGSTAPARDNSDGKFIFYFHPVEKDGKQYYIIYTHRQTTGPAHDYYYNNVLKDDDTRERWKKFPEYGNRDTYLCLKSIPSPTADYDLVTYKKFAGKMFNSGSGDYKYWFERFDESSSENEPRNPTSEREQTVSFMFADPMGPDEQAYFNSVFTQEGYLEGTLNNSVSLAAGLSNVYNEDECLWKIVTEEERDKYPIAANIDNPVDVSYKIKNHKFYPSYKPYETGGEDGDVLSFNWQWAESATGTALSHAHPYTSATDTEFHKIGTHHYDRWGWGETTAGVGNSFLKAKSDERTMTMGQEANYVGSIYNGTAALRQEITGLRPGRYIVYCRAFFAPFDMKKFDNKDIRRSFLDEKNSTPTYEGVAITGTQQSVINDQPLSDKSYFFAVSKPAGAGTDDVVRKRDLPSIFCGMMPVDESHLDKISLHDLIDYNYYDDNLKEYVSYLPQEFLYTPLGERLLAGSEVQTAGQETDDDKDDKWEVRPFWNKQVSEIKGHTVREGYDLLRDSTVFAMVTYDNQNYFVPRNLTGAARFFNATDRKKHENAFNYRIGLPVEVGDDGKLTIGVEHDATAGKEEWVCFDNFELVYYGNQNHWEFIVDESEPENNTRYHDLFDWETSTQAPYRSTTMVIKRGLDPKKYVPIVLPANLTKKQVKEAFGDDVKISTPSHITYKTIHFAAVSTEGSDNDVCMNAYQPYIVKPSIPAQVGKEEKWTRTRFVGENPFGWTAEQWDAYKDNETKRERIYIPKVGRNNRYTGDNVQDKNRREMKGPIYFVDSVRIEKETHYTSHKEESDKPFYDAYYNASNQWPALPTFVPTQQRRMKIKGSTDGKEYELQAVSYYDALGNVPPYSYFMSGGNLKFNGAAGSTHSKGFSFYLRIMELDKTGSAKVFMGNVADFVWEEVTNEATGISDAGQADQNPASDLYYDLQGRAVGSYPSKPGIYIYRGKKIAVK